MLSNTIGYWNTATGWHALTDNTSGYDNTALGWRTLLNNQTGNKNTANGGAALINNISGSQNTATGRSALSTNTTGSNNTGIGYWAFFDDDNLDNTTCIGNLSGGVVEASNRVEIGNTSVSWIGGQVAWSTYSDGRIKTGVKEDVPGLAFISRLRPVTYQLDIHTQNELCLNSKKEVVDWPAKYDIEKRQMTGFIAQEVEQAAKDIGYDFSGVERGSDETGLYSIRYAEFTVPLVKAVQELSDQIGGLQSVIKAQQEKLETLDLITQEQQYIIAELNTELVLLQGHSGLKSMVVK